MGFIRKYLNSLLDDTKMKTQLIKLFKQAIEEEHYDDYDDDDDFIDYIAVDNWWRKHIKSKTKSEDSLLYTMLVEGFYIDQMKSFLKQIDDELGPIYKV